MKQLGLNEIKKTMVNGQLFVSQHAIDQMHKRGYTKHDIVCCVWKGEITERQYHRNYQNKVVIEGYDTDHHPMVAVVGLSANYQLTLVTVFPPLKEKFKRII